MEAFSSLPTPQHDDENAPYLTRSQFDVEQQQQAQLAMQQEIWQDFDNYLPTVNDNISACVQHHYSQNSHLPSSSSSNGASCHCTAHPATKDIKITNAGSGHIAIISSTSATKQSVTSPEQQPLYPILEAPLHSSKRDIFCGHIKFRVHQTQNLTSIEGKSLPLRETTQQNMQKATSIYLNSSTVANTANTAQPLMPLLRKTAHNNTIERRYRNNINDRITELKNAVPALIRAKVKDSRTGDKNFHRATNNNEEDNGNGDDDDNEDGDGKQYLDGVVVATKLNKSTNLRKATEYILHLKRNSKDMRQENATLQHFLVQLPGGHELQSRCCMQKMQHEQEAEKKQILQEHAMQKHRQQREPNSRKRPSHPETTDKPCSFSNYVDPLAPRIANPTKRQRQQHVQLHHHQEQQQHNSNTSVTNRVFMAIFMAIGFFSVSPLSAGPTSKEQFENHNHISRTADSIFSSSTSSNNSFLTTFFPLEDGWSALRSTIFIICLVQLFFPILRFWCFYGFKVKRTDKKFRTASTKDTSSLSGNIASQLTLLTPGDQKCMEIYSILVKSLENDETTNSQTQSVLPQKHKRTLGFHVALGKEIARFVSRHWLGYEILYDDQYLTPQEQWVQACKWIKLNEVECLGGNPNVTRSSMLYSCFRMLNLIEMMEDKDNKYVQQSRSRVYATAALQMALVIPHQGLSEMLSRYFWRLSMYESDLEDDPLMRALIFDCHEDDGEDQMEAMLASRAWIETLEVMNQQIEHFGKAEARGLSLSMTAPVLVPVGILSTLHLLDNLQTQFSRLIISVTAKPLTAAMVAEESGRETAFVQLMDITDPTTEDENRFGDYHRLAHWLAAVGATVDALWKNDIKTAEKLLKTLVEKVPRSLVSREITGADIVCHKERMNHLDELTKKSMIHILVGAYLLKQEDEEQGHRGVEELWKAEEITTQIKKMINITKDNATRLIYQKVGLESSVLALAEFVTHVTGLGAWISAWRLAPALAGDGKDCDVWENTMTEQVRHASLHLRRMVRRHSLCGLRTNQVVVERLGRLGAYVSSQIDEIDSACECSEFDQGLDSEDTKEDYSLLLVRRSEKALEILRGIS